MIAQGFEFAGDFPKERNNSVYFRLRKIPCRFKEQAKTRLSREKCGRDIRATVSAWIADSRVQVIVTTGGAGVTGSDGTPDAVAPLLDKRLEGFGELFRMLSYEEIDTSTLASCALGACVANGTYIFRLPGSSGARRTGWTRIIAPLLDNHGKPCNLAMLIPRLQEN